MTPKQTTFASLKHSPGSLYNRAVRRHNNNTSAKKIINNPVINFAKQQALNANRAFAMVAKRNKLSEKRFNDLGNG